MICVTTRNVQKMNASIYIIIPPDLAKLAGLSPKTKAAFDYDREKNQIIIKRHEEE